MKRRKIKSSIAYFRGVILIISFSYLAYYSYTRSTKKIVSSEVSYSSVDNSSYEVYYSDSKIFSGKSLEESFVQKYTDIIKFDFDYNLNFTAGVSGKSETVVKSYLVIYAPNSSNELWKSDTEYLEKAGSISYKDSKRIHKTSNVEVDYKKYLDMYNKFKSETSIISSAKIYIEFINSSVLSYKDIDKIVKNDTTVYTVPVTDVTYTVSKKSTASGNVKTVRTYKDNKFQKKTYGLLFILLILLDILVLILMVIRYYRDSKSRGLYNSKLKRILRSYDNIIVNVKKIPDLSEKSVVNVTSFDELLDCQAELRIPINYAEEEKGYKALFVIINDDMAWVYKLENEKVKKKKDVV